MSSKAYKWRRMLDELQGKPNMTAIKEAMTGTQASAISGGISGLLLSFTLGTFTCIIHSSKKRSNFGMTYVILVSAE